jgi:hypothetical protein
MSVSSLDQQLRLLDTYDATAREPRGEQVLEAQLTTLLQEQGTPGDPAVVGEAVQAFLSASSPAGSSPSPAQPVTWWRPETQEVLNQCRARFRHASGQYIVWGGLTSMAILVLLSLSGRMAHNTPWFQHHPGGMMLLIGMTLLGLPLAGISWLQFASPLRHAFKLVQAMANEKEEVWAFGPEGLDLLSNAQQGLHEYVPSEEQLTRWMKSPRNRACLIALSQSDVPLLVHDARQLDAYREPDHDPLRRQHDTRAWSQLRQQLKASSR